MATQDGRLLEAFFEVGNICYLDNSSKAALRLCNKQIKSWIDATVIACKIKPNAVDALLRSDWHFLTELELQGAERSEIPPSEILPSALISKFPALEKLRIKTNFIVLASLPATIGELSHLKVFEVNSARCLTGLPRSFGQLTALERLEPPQGDALTLEGLAPIKELKHLKHLYLGGQPFRDPLFPEWIRSCKFTLLETLRLSDLYGDFHSSICTTFKHLTRLQVCGRDGLQVPESICSLPLLQSLDLYAYDEHISLPAFFSKLTTLKELDMIADMDGIAPLQHLTGPTSLILHAAYNDRFENYPDHIWNLISLKTLVLTGGCYVRSLPDDAFNKFKNLLDLKLHGFDSLQNLPRSIGKLSSLTELQLDGFNILNSLPESIGNLASLRSFYLLHSEYLSSLPDSIGNLKNLTSLEVGDLTKLTKLPCTIGNLEALQRLVVYNCNLVELPESIGNLHALQVLVIKDCNTRFRIPDSFADLAFGTASEDTASLKTALTKVAFNSDLEISDRCRQALNLLEEHGICKEF